MNEKQKVAECSPNGNIYVEYESYFESLDVSESSGYKLKDDELRLLTQWRSIKEAQQYSDRLALEEYEFLLNNIGVPKSDTEKFLYQKITDALNSLSYSDDEFVWERLLNHH